MNIRIAQHAGFCTGVERAYRIAVETAKKNIPVFVLGYLVHNSFVISKLESLGINTIRSLDEMPPDRECALIVSAHGVGPEIYEEAKKKCSEVIDTTCPWVKKAQRIAHELAVSGYQIVIVGDRDHKEVKGIAGWAGSSNVCIVEKPEDIKTCKLSDKVAVVAQTTQSPENFNGVVEMVRERSLDVVVHNTICGATSRRQDSAVELARTSDMMLVIGDARSANTKRLKELCERTGKPTHQIQDASELDESWLKGKENIGITAGASTPEEVIAGVVNKIRP